MELKQVNAFVEVAANGSYARAAGIFGVAQSALSRQVAALEREIGGRLFHRTGRGVTLTELGEHVLPRARALVADARAFGEAAREARSHVGGEVSLGIVPVAARGLVAALTARLRDAYPRIRLRANEAYSGQVEEWLAAGRVEIAIYNRYRGGRVANAEPLMRADMHLIVRADDPLARRREIALRALAGVPLAMPVAPNSLSSLLVGLAAARHFALDVRFESGSSPLTREAILASGLATVSPIEPFRRDIEAGDMRAIRIMRPSIRQTTWMSLGSQRPPSAAARMVARLIRELARQVREGGQSS